MAQVIDVKARVHDCVIDSVSSSISGDEFVKFDLLRRNGVSALATSAGSIAAIINTKTSLGLQGLGLADLKLIRLEAFVSAMEWNKGLRVWRNNKEHAVIMVEINIYGPRQDAEAVGTVLTKAALFLQQPRYNPESKDYFNPHYIRLVDSLDGIYTTPTIFTGDGIEMGEAVAVNQASTFDISSILDTLSHCGYLQNGTTDRRIKSVLLEYVFCVSHYITLFRDILL